MKFTCIREYFLEASSATERIIERGSALPILQNILLTAEKGRVTVSSTNLEIGVKASFQAKVEEEGSVTVPAKVVSGILQYTGDEKVLFLTKGNTATVQAGQYTADVKTTDAKDFPIIPDVGGDAAFTVPGSEFTAALGRLIFLAATGEIRPELGGVFCTFEKGQVRIAATDSFRLGEQVMKLPPQKHEAACIIPTRTVAEVIRLFTTAKELSVRVSANQILFQATDRELVSRLVEGKYPEYGAVIPTSFTTHAQLKREDFAQMLRAASIFSGKNRDVKITLNPQKNSCTVESRNSDVGEQTATIPCEGQGKALSLACNYQYFLDAIGKLDEDMVSIEGNGETDPLLVRDATKSGVRYLIMPLRGY